MLVYPEEEEEEDKELSLFVHRICGSSRPPHVWKNYREPVCY